MSSDNPEVGNPIIDARALFARQPETVAGIRLPAGHRRTGVVMRKGELGIDPAIAEEATTAKPVPETEEHEVAVKKSQAISIATGLTKGKALGREERGYCVLTVKIRGVKFEAREISWWKCLRALHATLKKSRTPAE